MSLPSSNLIRGLTPGLFIAVFAGLPLVGLVRAEPTRLGTGIPSQGGIERVGATTPMARCLASWDRSTQMSKREWKDTCRRVVKNNPNLYNKPF